jgi:glycosyltransferase involved in cell wall biosynthesis
VHRLSRSKRLEIAIKALTFLPESYTLTVYGMEAESDYVAELRLLVAALGLASRVTFKGSIPMEHLAEVYPQHRLIVNMASETIDKSMLEAMTCGCYPVTTKRNAQAIVLRDAPTEDTPAAVAKFIAEFPGANPDELYRLVQERHSLDGMIARMDQYIAAGI